ncbi:hypothetical protein niasHT_022331 [Heterodera trifolii]|uniref:Uncharacterized protein n=1 Tax=Heterodera trifolii TaxID=157864 RepID=A0ABD2KPV2_9BILA
MRFSSFSSPFLPLFFLSLPIAFVLSGRTLPFTGSQLANEVARAFFNSVNTWDMSIFGAGTKQGEDRYKISLDGLDRMKNRFRVPLPAGQGLEKLLRSYRVEPLREDYLGVNKARERVLAPSKLMELMEKLGNVLVTDPKMRQKIDKYDKKRADEAARRAAMMPPRQDPQAIAKRRTWPKEDGLALERGHLPQGNSQSPTRLQSTPRVWIQDDDRWRQPMTFSRKDVRERTWLESDTDSDLDSPTSVLRSRRRSRVNILDDDQPPRRTAWGRSPTPSPNGRAVVQRTTTTTTTTTEEEEGGRRTVRFGEVVVVEPEERTVNRRTEVRTQQRETEVERTSDYTLILRIDFIDASVFLDKSLAYFGSLNIARKDERSVQRLCYILKAFDPRHERLNSVLATPSVANAFVEYKKALNDVGLTSQPELRLVEKSNACAFDLALIYELAQFTKDLLLKLKAERMVAAEELEDVKEEVIGRLLKLLPKVLEGLKPKPAELSTEVDRRIQALDVVEEQFNVVKRARVTDEMVTGAMAKVMAQLRNASRGMGTMDMSTLSSLQSNWDNLMRKDTHWQIRKAINSLGGCPKDPQGNTLMKQCMEEAITKVDRYIDDVNDWFKSQRPIDMDDWKWLAAEIQMIIRWKSP